MGNGGSEFPPSPPASDCRRQVDKIIESEVFRGSEILRRLLEFLAHCAIDRPNLHVRAPEIATQVFGRSEDFDSQTDSVVRVHAGRLRSKLAEYAIGEGAQDQIVVEMPRGGYQLVFRYRVPGEYFEKPPAAESDLSATKKQRLGLLLTASVALLGGLLFGYLLFRGRPPAAPASLRTFWQHFVKDQSEPLVIFSTPRFVGSHLTGMRYYDPALDHASPVIDTYTGVSEVFGIHAITSTFARFQRPVRVRRGQTVTWDEARGHNLILLGGPDANESFRDLPRLEQFIIKGSASEPERGIGAIFVEQPRPGEPNILRGPSTRPYTFDYAIIALVPGLSPGRHAMVLAGITTLGTQAAAEFVCREQSVTELLNALGVSGAAPVPHFEAVLKVRGSGGVPVESQLISWRIRKSAN